MSITIEIVPYKSEWPQVFEINAQRITAALENRVRLLEHIGSTSVPGLAAKPIIDIVLAVDDAADEAAYVPALEAAGYHLRIREPAFDEHRLLKTAAGDVHLHVFPSGSREIVRCLRFRDRLRADATDRRAYEDVKRQLAGRPWADMDAYATAKTEIVERILAGIGPDRRL